MLKLNPLPLDLLSMPSFEKEYAVYDLHCSLTLNPNTIQPNGVRPSSPSHYETPSNSASQKALETKISVA